MMSVTNISVVVLVLYVLTNVINMHQWLNKPSHSTQRKYKSISDNKYDD